MKVINGKRSSKSNIVTLNIKSSFLTFLMLWPLFRDTSTRFQLRKLDIFLTIYLNNILIYTKDPDYLHANVIHWVLDQLQKYFFFANLKKCCYHQDDVCFLRYIVSSKNINMETKKIKVIKNWPEPKLVCDIQVFLNFANFY